METDVFSLPGNGDVADSHGYRGIAHACGQELPQEALSR